MLKAISLIGAVGPTPAMAAARSSDAEIRAALSRYADAWISGDTARIAACYHGGFTLHYFGRNTLSGDHVGKANALKILAAFTARTRRRLIGISAIMVGDGLGAIVARERLMQGIEPVEVERLLTYRVVDGLLIECWVHDQDQRLIDAIVG
ncbi:hypothetical protein ACVWZA_004251 [Sphingomonas sp. UYAg733]